MKRLLFIMIIAPLLLTACSNASAPKEDNIVERKDGTTKEKSESDSEEDEVFESNQNDNEETESGKENNQQKQDSNPNANKENENKQKKDEPLIKYEELTVEEILAMTIIEQKTVSNGTYKTVMPTVEEIFAGEYTREYYDEVEGELVQKTFPIEDIYLNETGGPESIVKNSPNNILNVYIAGPAVINSMPIFVLEEDHVILYIGVYGPIEYNEYQDLGHRYSIKEMYERNKHNEDVIKLAEMTSIRN